jgi:hypothetical protein
MTEQKTIPLPGPPVSMTLLADGKPAYCSVQDMDTVSEIKTPPHSGPDPVLPIRSSFH